MDRHLAEVIQIALVSGTFLTAFAIFMFARHKPARLDQRAVEEVALRLERIEQAVDAIAIEVERISEGQRFTSRLLAEKDGPARPPARHVTPH